MLEKKPRKQGINPRTKGKSFERKIARALSDWYGQEVKRVPTSGAWDKVRFPGDLYSDEDFPLCTELKKKECWSEKNFWDSKSNAEIDGWWEQCYSDSLLCPRQLLPVVIFSRNRSNKYIMHSIDFDVDVEKRLLYTTKKGVPLYIFLLEDWLQSCEYTAGEIFYER